MAKTGVLLMNIGTPSGSDTESVQEYLSEFLTDRDVINAPTFIRELVFRRWVVPRRAPQSARKYQAIWTDKGSPLMVHSREFAEQLQKELDGDYVVRVGMRYGSPSILDGLREIQAENCSELVLVPLYPQWAQATTGSSVRRARENLKDLNKDFKYNPKLRILPEFYREFGFIQSWKELLSPVLPEVDHLLFSFHGLPVRQLKHIPGCQTASDCCAMAEAEGRVCYKAQCLRTAGLVAQALGLSKEQWSVSFQSRLGPVKWIEPYTDHVLADLAKKGVARLGICAPSFVVDGLETLEELNIEGRNLFLSQGGKSLIYVPCLNVHGPWVKRFAGLITGRPGEVS